MLESRDKGSEVISLGSHWMIYSVLDGNESFANWCYEFSHRPELT